MSIMKPLTARSPAKLILSGEHAVLYGKPALAMAVNRYVSSTASAANVPSIVFNLKNLKYARSLTLQTLKELKERLLIDYYRFLEGRCRIRDVLEKPFELLQFTVFNLIEKLSVDLPHGVHIQTSSTIPIGCGMGSSAATVISVLKALAHFFKIDLDPIKYLSLGKDAENLQHGRSSGLDLHLALHGGSIYFQNGMHFMREVPKVPIFLIHTGRPLSTTGECVESVKPYFENSFLAEEFEVVTNTLDRAFSTHQFELIQESIKENHQLLKKIGVVPLKVQHFIRELEDNGAVSKVCGAGSIRGDNAGMLLVVSDSEIDLSDIVTRYDYTIERIKPDFNGTQII